ncbi:hypothetical protein [Bifidobacterium cuniculi]|uniref:Uncharacterized protein n=1 Tax=Bifidobacterium cuniculi TaxID=1688 RepID=A0A087AYP6_9BIFI|nr:hypothetical protein [Bifidobacterium cuniculi]KFI63896.1 hypothetical protein BCUN_1508 [Bifidobacterium cuniculi]
MRIAGIAVAAIALAHLPAAMALDAAVVLVVAGCLMVAVMLAQRGGLYSLVLSRIGDGLCFLALGLVPSSALLAAGLLEWLRGMQW